VNLALSVRFTKEAAMDEQTLRALIRTKPRDGRLPVTSVPRVWGGPGRGEKCVACEAVIMKDP
jgi:hypothetical protein